MTITANTQNPRWKAFVGNVVGSFTLDDGTGSTIYDWSLASVTGRIYSTRTSGVVSWSTIRCANSTDLEDENDALNLSSNTEGDRINETFSAAGGGTHDLFWVAGTSLAANSCPTLNTYVNNVSQVGTDFFQEMAIDDDSSNLIYATILEEDQTGYDGQDYDFQMIVPEDGTPGFDSATAYYLYVELGS